MMKRLFALLLLPVFLSGCFFDHPLSGPSKDINTWLLGVWEHTDDKGQLTRIRCTPLSPARYAVVYIIPGGTKRETREWRYEAWISHVGNSRYLVLKCLETAAAHKGETQIPVGSYVFIHYQVVNQFTVLLRELQLTSDPSASSFQLRKEVRQKQKDGTLLPEAGTPFTRTSEVYWNKEDPWAAQPFQSLRYQLPLAGDHEKIDDDKITSPNKEKGGGLGIKGL
jgi:hypothetical protein